MRVRAVRDVVRMYNARFSTEKNKEANVTFRWRKQRAETFSVLLGFVRRAEA